jgi:acetyl esterase/lipase
MKNTISFLLLIFITSLIGCSQEIKESQISGKIINTTESTLKIGSQTVPITEDGKFTFIKVIERPILLDVSYANLEWTIFLKPESIFDVLISEKSFDAIEYTGELISSNTYLLETSSLTNEINAFFNKNWLQLHRQNQTDYVSTIDSLKGLYLKHLTIDSKRYETFSQEFIKIWKAEIDFGFNTLILRYPERHFQFTDNKVELSRQTIDYTKTSKIDCPEYIDLPSYKKYTKSWIDYESETLIEKDSSQKHYNLKKIEATFQIISKIFENQYLKDFWLAEYLKEHIDKNGIANGTQIMNQFKAICKTEVLKNDIEQYITSVMETRKDHEVKIYKTENAFHLEAHIFKPEDISSTEKRPAIVIFHGGGWNGGKPSWSFGRAKHFKDLGMVAIAAQYRLTNEHDITALESMSDARDLIMWMRLNSDSLGILPDNIVAYGWSAGAHLVSSAAIFSDSIPKQGINSIPNSMILISPAVSLPKSKGWEAWKLNVFGAKTTVSSANPVEHVRKGLPPIIILQGRDDTVTPLDGVQLFHDKMLANGNHCELVIYDGVGHLFTPNTMPDYRQPNPDVEVQKKAYNKADEFLKKLGYIKE